MTYYLLAIILSLLLAAIGLLVRRRSESVGVILVVLGVAGCLGSIGWQARQTLFTPESKGPDRGQAVVAYFLANQLLSEIGDRQGTILLLFPPEGVFDEDTAGTYAGTFNRVLRGFPGLKVEIVSLNVPVKPAKAGKIPLGAFREAISNNSPALVCVSFTGAPPDIQSLLSGGGSATVTPQMYVFDPWGTTNWLAALKSGRLRTVIVPRHDVRAASGDVAGEPAEVFRQLYLQATPTTADEVAGSLLRK